MADPHTFALGVRSPPSASAELGARGVPFVQMAGADHLMRGDIRIVLTGGNQVGDILRVAVDRPVGMPVSAKDFATQWRRDGQFIPWENERTYRIRLADKGHKIDCLVTDATGLSSSVVCVE